MCSYHEHAAAESFYQELYENFQPPKLRQRVQ